MLFDQSAPKVFFSEKDAEGTYNIYGADKLSDTLYSAPALLGESLVSVKDDIYPVLSPDGSRLYFTSSGLAGMGGFDVYVSTWNDADQEWGEPENLGFPFSSPYDDFLFTPTPDGNFSLLASNRNCPDTDSVDIFVFKYDSTPVKTALTDLEEIRKVARLDITRTTETAEKAELSQTRQSDSLFISYSSLISRFRAVKDSIRTNGARQTIWREEYLKASDPADQKYFEKLITDAENQTLNYQMQLGELSASLSEMEMDFLMKGIIINLDEISGNDITQEDQSAELPEYQFEKRTVRNFPAGISFEEPEAKIDYEFKILDEAVIVEDNTLPDGLVYQIQLLATSKQVGVKDLKGLSPVFENRQTSGKYIYTAGLFYSYNEALGNLSTVKRRFSSAIIVAFNDGKSISLQNAKKMESSSGSDKGGGLYRVVLSGYTEALPANILQAIQANTTKDIARGSAGYSIAPFDSKAQAEQLAQELKNAGAENVVVEAIK